jgi:2-phosphosulfolactate phosphatase
MKVNVFLNPNFNVNDTQFDDSIVVMIDVLRASSTIAAALHNGAKEVIPTENSDQAMRIFGSLDRSIRFIGGEKNNEKPAGFDAGNSPLEYLPEIVSGKTVIFTTTNGAPLFTKTKDSKMRLVASFVNFQVILDKLIELVQNNKPEEFKQIYFLCAGSHGQFSYEDSLCAGGLIYHLSQKFSELELTDAADAVRNLYNFHNDNLFEFLTSRDHAQNLIHTGHSEDLEICLNYNRYPVVPVISGSNIRKL